MNDARAVTGRPQRPPRSVSGFGGINMSRVIAVVACGLFVAACSTAWMPSFQMPSLGGGSPAPVSLAVESDPPGAQASTPGGGSCVTPCRLNVTADAPFSVNVALDGYVPQSVPVRIMQPDDPRLGSEDTGGAGPHLDPNPVYVELERAPPPPAAPVKKRKKKAKAPATAAIHAPAATAATQPAPSAPTTAVAPATMAPPPAAAPALGPSPDTPWPMPR